MVYAAQINDTRTSVDDIFDLLRSEILSLKLRPGDKLSEVEMAARFGVSRQPVRDAFSRLANQDLLVIRPKRATVVKRFSTREINKARFVRSAIEERVLRLAAKHCDLVGVARLNMSLAEQEKALKNKDVAAFGELDYDFHKILCEVAQVDFAFDVVMAEKAKIDRLCALGLAKEYQMPELISDHYHIAKAVENRDADGAVDAGMKHLGRLGETIKRISAQNADYFDPE